MTEGWKSLRARFEKLNENHQQDGKNELKSLQSQNPSKLGVFLYRNRNQDIFSNEEELNSLERNYQAILKETSNDMQKNKSPIQALDRISKRYSKLRSQVESKITTSTPQIHFKRFKADHSSFFFSYTPIHPIIEENNEKVVDEEQEELAEPSTTFVEVHEKQLTTEELTPEEIDDDEFYEEYEEYEEHPVVSTSPIDVTKTIISDNSNIEALPESSLIDTVEEYKSSELPIITSKEEQIIDTTPNSVEITTTTLPTSSEPEDHVVEFEEEDYLETFEEYDIEESHVVDHTPLSPTIVTDEVFQTSNTIESIQETTSSPSLEPAYNEENATTPCSEEVKTNSTPTIVEKEIVSPSIEDKTPLQQQPVFVEQPIDVNSLEIVEKEITTITLKSSRIDEKAPSSPKLEEKTSPKTTKTIEKSPEKQSIVSTPNVHESKETTLISLKPVVVKEEKLLDPSVPIKVEEPKQTTVKPLPIVTKDKLAEIPKVVESSEPKALPVPVEPKQVVVETPKVETNSQTSTSFTILNTQKETTTTVEVKLITEPEKQIEKETVQPIKPIVEIKPLPILKALPQQPSLPVVDSPTKPLPLVPKKPVKALPVVSPKPIEVAKDVFEVQASTSPVDSEPITPVEPESTPTTVVETKPDPVFEKKASEPTISRTASIRSYFSSFLSKTPKKPDPKVSPLEIKEIETPIAKPLPAIAKMVKEESIKEGEESDDETTEHSVVNIDDFLSEGEPESNIDPQSVPKSEKEDIIEEEKISDIISTHEEEPSSSVDVLVSVLEKQAMEKGSEGRKVSITSTTDSHSSSGERSDSRKSKRANRKKTGSSPHQQEAGALLLQEFLDSNPSSRSSSTKKEATQELAQEVTVEHAVLEDFIGEDCALLSTISETNTTTSNTLTHPSPSRSDSAHNETTPLSCTPKSLYDLYSPITPKRKEKMFENFVDPSTFPKGWEKPYTFLYTEKPLMEHPLLDKLRRNIIDLLTSSMTEETRVSGIVNINRTSPLLAPLVHSIYSILTNRTKPTIFKSDRDLCTIFSKLDIVKKEKIVQDFLAFKEVRILDPKKLKERDLLFIQYLLQSKLLAVCTYELALNQKYTAMCFEETSIMNLEEYSPTIFAVLNLLKKHFNFELKFEFELSQQAGGSKEEGTLIATLQGNIKTLLQYIIEIGKNEKIPINAITDESKNHNIGKVVRSLIMYILKSILMDKLISESKWKNFAGTLISHPWHLITACAKGELSKVGMNVKTGYSFDSIVLTIDSTVKKKNQTTKQQLLDDKFFSFVVYCLNYQILTDALKFIFKNIMILEKNYRPDSIMCDPVQQDHILTILTPLSKLRFTLNFY
ncbi:predicted protein [Naegleria gruberi]|uniref:Predicted protein n=1 Tax=Naegleria gruberi TaxID=5762 RepID=D2VJZ8_NAEGR|nr:uncharacterized protein NAEGRDRAFT_69218 [Naegleria gruberi]EFC42859.1 predicted protein [Naegleria gruberi]|eukprot:XP_002675603.1 predicted protein [Naegleria gruberi strain NEG-M]